MTDLQINSMDRDVQQEIRYTNVLKGAAILAVVLLHILSTIPNRLIIAPTIFPFVLTLDQLARFCVPLFIAVSGFGLMRKYLHQTFDLGDFFKRRMLRLLPLYILWSLVTLLLAAYSHTWSWMSGGMSVWTRLLLGKSDYHLYFVILIIQLYALFPFLLWTAQKSSKLILLCAGLIQVGTYLLYSAYFLGIVTLPVHLSDQRMYLSLFSWIWYFVLGMFLAQILEHKKSRLYWMISVFLCIGGLSWTLQSGLLATAGSDTITTLRFTRFPVLFYATGVILCALSRMRVAPGKIAGALAWFGQHSYLVFLSHLLLVRAICGWYFATADLWSVGVVLIGTLCAIAASHLFRME